MINRYGSRGLAHRLSPVGAAVFAACIAAGAIGAEAEDEVLEEVVVSGYRASLANAAAAKRESTSFTESVFAEDIGKFPDTNIAESFNRVPGVTISREVSGEGLNIAIRGLGTNFTRILLNNAPVAIASTGRTDATNTNREVDLDLFPSELFTQLTVAKSPTAQSLEGGAAGVVNMRSARPFDREGTRVTYSGGLSYNSPASDPGYRAALIGSTTQGPFGVLAGISAIRNEFRSTGFETIGWTNPAMTAAQRAATTRNATGGGNWNIPATVPTNAGNNLVVGSTIDEAYLLALNPGATIEQIDNGLIPRLGRPMDESGRKDRVSAVVALEYRPSDDLQFFVDSMYGKKSNDFERIDMNWVGRFGAMIPINTTYDRTNCAAGCVATSGTYANAQWFLEYRPYKEDGDFYSLNPGFGWKLADKFKVDVNANLTGSDFHRESPTVLVITPASSGVTVFYDNTGKIPEITTNIDLNDASRFGWPGGRVNIQDEKRSTLTRGLRTDMTWGDRELNLRFGAAFDEVSRRIQAFDNSQAWQNSVCGNRPNAFLPNPNSQPGCNGAVLTGAAPAGYPSYPGFGTGYSTGFPAFNYLGSAVPNAQVPSFLRPGPSGFVTLDWDAFRAATDYDTFHASAPDTGAANTSAGVGYIKENTKGFYVELNGDRDIAGHRVRYNAGVRRIDSDVQVGSRVSVVDSRNAPTNGAPLADGARYPNVVRWEYDGGEYRNWLPSGTVAYNATEDFIVRLAYSKTLTRPNPGALIPGLQFVAPSADTATLGNPGLTPYLSNNIDLGLEYYTGGEGYVALAVFAKDLKGFTKNQPSTVTLADFAPYGVNFNSLTAQQQLSIGRALGFTEQPGGGYTQTQLTQIAAASPGHRIQLNQQVNANSVMRIRGLELTMVQSLDPLLGRIGLDGFGINANLTLVDVDTGGADPIAVTGVADLTNNITLYYERGPWAARISQTYTKGSTAALGPQNGVVPPSGASALGVGPSHLYNDPYRQWDFSSSLDLSKLIDAEWAPQVTFDVVNLTSASQRQYFQFENATFTAYKPGRTFLLGVRGTF